jgi:hypothetical protein
VDAEFAGFWPYDKDKIKSCCFKSRTGFGNCTVTSPLVGASKLQSDIESSTLEDATSMAIKEVRLLMSKKLI